MDSAGKIILEFENKAECIICKKIFKKHKIFSTDRFCQDCVTKIVTKEIPFEILKKIIAEDLNSLKANR